jgi:hypothetical protein
MSGKRWVGLVGAGVAAAVAIYAMFEIIVVAVVSAAVASLVTFFLYRYLGGRSKPPPPPRPDPRQRLLDMLGSLVDLNIRIREKGLAKTILARVEHIIDKLRDLLEDINERHPEHELTWTLNQMAKQYLPKVMNPYLALSVKDRDGSQEELLRSLDGLEAEIDNVADLVRGDKLGDFKAKAAFLRARFVQQRV